jgi:hypothetical protein
MKKIQCKAKKDTHKKIILFWYLSRIEFELEDIKQLITYFSHSLVFLDRISKVGINS